MVGGTAEGTLRGQDPGRLDEVLDGRDLPGEVVEPDRAARRPRRVCAHGEEAEVVVVLAAGRTQEDRTTAERALDDLEAEDPAVELRRPRRVTHVQDGVVEASDRDPHGRSLPRAGGGVEGARHAAALTVAGAPTSFQPDCQLPSFAMFTVMLRNARPSSWRARASGPTSTGSRPIEATSCRTSALAVGVVAGDEAVELDALGDRVGLVRGEQGVERLDDVGPGQQPGELLGVGRGRVDLGTVRRRTTCGWWRR